MMGLFTDRIKPRILTAFFAALSFGGEATAQTSGVSGNFQYTATATEVTIVRFPQNRGGSVTVPSTINGLPVTVIGAAAFDNCQFISSITLPTSIRTLSTAAFDRCSGLSSFTIPSGVTWIQGNVFEGCSNLTSITVSSQNTQYSSLDGILYNKSRTSLITIPEYKSGAVVLPSTLTTIRTSSAGGCNRITSISIPASVSSILSTFPSCRMLATITVDPANPNYSSREGMLYNKDFSALIRVPGAKTGRVVVEEGTTFEGAFSSAYSVEEVVLPASTTVIADYMFAECESLSAFVLPAGVTSIGQFAFRNCDLLEEMIIPDTVQTIGRYAFASCRSLIRVRLPTHLTVIGDSWFVSCESLTDINMPQGLLRIENSAFSNATSLANVMLPETVEYIGSSAFIVTGLRTIRIPASVNSIGAIAFSICRNLTEIRVDPANPNYASYDGVLYSKDLKTLIQCPAGKSGIVTVPDSVTAISQNAFSNCANITAIRFMGNAPAWGSSAGTTPEILYFEGRTGFGATWNGFTATNDGQPVPTGLWLVSHGLPYDRDLHSTAPGIPLLLAYALDIAPDSNAAAAVPETEVGGDAISLTYFAGRSDITYVPECATELDDWKTEGIVISEADANGFRTATCARSGGAQFMRLKVVQAATP